MFDGNGISVLAKHLEAGRFTWPRVETASVRIRNEELAALVNGLEVMPKKNWYRQ